MSQEHPYYGILGVRDINDPTNLGLVDVRMFDDPDEWSRGIQLSLGFEPTGEFVFCGNKFCNKTIGVIRKSAQGESPVTGVLICCDHIRAVEVCESCYSISVVYYISTDDKFFWTDPGCECMEDFFRKEKEILNNRR